MNEARYADRINSWDHNVVCKSIFEDNNMYELRKKIIDTDEGIRYKGFVSLQLLSLLER
jgi:hypothetical protein